MNKYDKPVDSIIEESNAKLVVVKDSGRDCDNVGGVKVLREL